MRTIWAARRLIVAIALVAICLLAAMATPVARQREGLSQAPATSEQYLGWTLAAADAKYGRIDGDHLMRYVEELAAIGHKERDEGNPYWGRIIGTDADTRARAWTMEKFRNAGLKDVHDDPFDGLAPQWFGVSWEMTASAGDKSIKLPTARPYVGSVATPAAGIDLEPVWLGLGTPADFAGRDVRGKAVFLFSVVMPNPLIHTAGVAMALGGGEGMMMTNPVQRAVAAGAGAIIAVIGIPGNVSTQLSLNFPRMPVPVTVPILSTGMEDGTAVRQLIESGKSTVHIRVETKMVSDLKSGDVWGTLPGATDEEIMIGAHRDGYFDGAGDNATGMAALVGLAEYFAKIPQAQRPRTIKFLSSTGHHHGGRQSSNRMHENRETLFAKTVLFVNLEHVAWTQLYWQGQALRSSNAIEAQRWYVRGSDRVKAIAQASFQAFGVPTYRGMEKNLTGEFGAIAKDVPLVQIIASPVYYHTDHDTPDVVPPTGLAAATRAFARIIDEVNRLDRKSIDEPRPVTTRKP